MNVEKRDFNKDAATWDENPGRIKMAESVFKSIEKNLKLSKDLDVLDFGCGTGLLSIRLLPLVHSVTGADSSSGMLDVLNSKKNAQKLTKLNTLYINIENGERLTGRYDIVTSSMTMHHIKDPAPLIKQFHEILKPGGYLCIADLDPDEGKFHDNNDGVFHKGFNRVDMKLLFKNQGFTEVSDFTAAELEKPGDNGSMRRFSIFLIIGKKM